MRYTLLRRILNRVIVIADSIEQLLDNGYPSAR